MNNPKPSGYGDPEKLAAMVAAETAEIDLIEAKVIGMADELYQYHLSLMKLYGLRPQQAVVALLETTAKAVVTASMMTPNPTDYMQRYLQFFDKVIEASLTTMNAHSLGSIITNLYKEIGGCSKKSSSAAPQSSSPSKSDESSSSSSGESK